MINLPVVKTYIMTYTQNTYIIHTETLTPTYCYSLERRIGPHFYTQISGDYFRRSAERGDRERVRERVRDREGGT